jgi:hypothetical protein
VRRRKWRGQTSQLETDIRTSKSQNENGQTIHKLPRLNYWITKTQICRLWNSHFNIRVERSKSNEWTWLSNISAINLWQLVNDPKDSHLIANSYSLHPGILEAQIKSRRFRPAALCKFIVIHPDKYISCYTDEVMKDIYFAGLTNP